MQNKRRFAPRLILSISLNVKLGGEERIRTSGAFRHTVFPGPRTRPTMRPLHEQVEIYRIVRKKTTSYFILFGDQYP